MSGLKTIISILTVAAAATLAACGGDNASDAPSSSAASSVQDDALSLRPATAFAEIAGDEERAAAIFTEMFKVISSPRCMNCHPRDDAPRQGDLMAAHQPPVARGPAGLGLPGMECGTCHGEANVAFVTSDGSIPGHQPWALAPKSMGWIGLQAPAVCAQLKDQERNGGRDLAAVHEHMAEDGLVGWAWDPGEGRAPAPGSQAVFGELTQAWIDAGAHCPA
ncbi:MAG: Isoquinoline 1-oxidoreductase subunit [Parvularculaceae bacterium]